jgi:outer membrane protein TolC
MDHVLLRRRFRIGGWVWLLLLVLQAAPLVSAQENAPAGAPAPQSETAVPIAVLTLQECQHLALEKQPTLAACRATLAEAEARLRALDNLRLAAVIERDLPIRRQQACLGIRVAEAQLHQAENNATFSVTRNYLAYVYALQQLQVANDGLKGLDDLFKRAKELVDAGATGVKQWQVDRITVDRNVVAARRQEALQGTERALAALREAMGVEPCFCFRPAATALPYPRVVLCRGDLVALALQRREELHQVALFADLTALEVDAQGASHLFSVPTFAAGSDIHAQPVPPELRDGIYRPGGLPPLMPTLIAGNRGDRVEQARTLACRAQAVVDKTRQLIALETEDTYLRWVEAGNKLEPLQTAINTAQQRVPFIESKFEPRLEQPKASLDDILDAQLLWRQQQVHYNEALFQYDLGLAELQRATAGGFCAEFGPAPAPQPAAP